MKKNGFTLIELLGVIIVLGVLVTIIAVTVTNVLDDSETRLTEIQIKKIEDAAKNYYINEGMESTDFEQDSFNHCVNVNYLIENGYIDENEISNFETGEDMLGSVKISYNSKKYKYKYKEDSCKVCSLIDDIGTKGISEGDKYQCKVKDDMEKDFKDGYYFYVLGINNDESVNLIMDRNINSDGTAVTKAMPETEKDTNGGIYNLVAWVSREDYNDDINYGEEGNNDKGPITAMNFLQKATKKWINTNEMIVDTFTDDIGVTHNMKTYNTYARMPYYNEVVGVSKKKMWLIDYLDGNEDEGLGIVGRNGINSIFGYWALSSTSNNSIKACRVNYHGNADNNSLINRNSNNGVRPVITLPKNKFENSNW